jgi:2'-5' RNA ligase superfamily
VIPAGRLAAATETAIIVAVAAVEPAVARYRQALDHSAVWGVPAHVTVLYPFVPPAEITATTVADVRAAVSAVSAFDCSFPRLEWFGDDVLWLAPEPDGPFRDLTTAVWRRFPDRPPYGGAFPDVIPHLTIGTTRAASRLQLQRAATDLASALPIAARIDRAHLIAGTDAPGSWETIMDLPLGS